MRVKTYFNARHYNPPRIIGPEVLENFAARLGLDSIAPNRYSPLFVFQIMVYAEIYGITPEHIVDEIKGLEGVRSTTQTKSCTAFKSSGALAGLWHKHFTSSTLSMVASNILAARSKKILTRLAANELGANFTTEAIAKFVDKVVVDGYEQRATANKLTGEWIVFVEHEGQNYYLCLATHNGGDDEILGYIRNICHLEFPFLKAKLPHLFVDPALPA